MRAGTFPWRCGSSVRAALPVAVLLVSACAAERPVLVSPGGRLRVENASGEPVEVFARGDRVARLADGADVRLDRLPLGDCPVEARGDRTGWRMGEDRSAGTIRRGVVDRSRIGRA